MHTVLALLHFVRNWHRLGYPSLIARFMRPTWGSPGTDRTQVGPMSAPWTLLSGMSFGVLSLASVHPLHEPWKYRDKSHSKNIQKIIQQQKYRAPQIYIHILRDISYKNHIGKQNKVWQCHLNPPLYEYFIIQLYFQRYWFTSLVIT